jgi:hypothetical protein
MPLVFLVPVALAGLVALGVPLVLHLRRRERERPTRFPSLMFLQQVSVTTARRRRITDWPLLLLRAAIVTLLVLAFARPVIRPRRGALATGGTRRVVIALDRSMSMQRAGVWQAARDSAHAILRSLRGGDRVAVIAFDAGATIVQPLTADDGAAAAAIDRVQPGSGSTHYAAAMRAASQLLVAEVGQTGGEIVVVTDLQRNGAAGMNGATLPPRVQWRAVDVAPGVHGNSAITGIELERVANNDTTRPRLALSAEIVSHALPAPRRVHVTLLANGHAAGATDLTLPADGLATASFRDIPLPVGAVRVRVSVTPDSLVADDVFRAVVPADPISRVILVADADEPPAELFYLEQALGVVGNPALHVERRTAGSLSAAVLHGALAVIVDDATLPSGAPLRALTAYVQAGGGLVDLAAARSAHRVAVELLPGTVLGMIDRTADDGGMIGMTAVEHPIFAPFRGTSAAALRSARFFRYPRLISGSHAQVLARFDDGSAAVLARDEGAGHVVMTAVPLDATSGDFPLQAAYLPFVRAMVMYVGGAGQPLPWHTVGDAWLVPAEVREPIVRTPSGALLRPQRIGAARTVTLDEAGFYAVYDGRATGDPWATLAVNPDPRESDLAPMRARDMLVGVRQDSLGSAASAASDLVDVERRQRIWRTLLLLAALALLGELGMSSRGWRGTVARVVGARSQEAP